MKYTTLASAIIATAFIDPTHAAFGQVISKNPGLETGGERAHQDAYYRRLIVAHALFAVLAFLVTVPLALIAARYGKHVLRNGKWWKVHAILHTFTVACVTIVFVLGYYAVGPKNNFDNVHHRIGLTVVVAVFLQYLLGLTNTFLLSRPHVRTPLQNRLHILLGWLTWVLAIANMPVGMVLYGSPQWAFGLWAAAAFVVAVVVVGFEIGVGRREDHNVRVGEYVGVGKEEEEGPVYADGVGATDKGVPAAPAVNWNGEVKEEKRAWRRLFGRG